LLQRDNIKLKHFFFFFAEINGLQNVFGRVRQLIVVVVDLKAWVVFDVPQALVIRSSSQDLQVDLNDARKLLANFGV